MSNRDRYTEHRPLRSCLGPHVGRAPADTSLIDALASRAYHEHRGIFFSEDQLKSMSWEVRAFIESQARKIHGPRRERG